MRHTSFRFTVFLSLFVLLAGAARASVIKNGTDTGLETYTINSSADKTAIFTGSGTLVKADNEAGAFTGSLTGFDGVLQITGQYWTFGGSNMVKGTDKDLELNVQTSNYSDGAIFNNPDAASPISFHYSVLNGSGNIRTSRGTKIRTCTLVVGTDTQDYDGVNGHVYSGNIIKWDIDLGGQSDFTLEKVGTNTQTLSGDNWALTNVKVSGGVLEVAKANALGNASITMNGGTLRLSAGLSWRTYTAATEEWKPSGTIEVNNTSDTPWVLNNYQTGEDISFVKTGSGTVKMYGNYSGGKLKSVEIKEGTILITNTENKAELARVFPASSTVKVYEGATVEYAVNPMDYNGIPAYTLNGGELKSNIANSHLTTGEVNLYGGTLTGTGDGSTNFGNFLFDKNVTVYPSEEYGNTSEINAKAVQFSFRVASTKAITVEENAQLNVNAVVKFYQAGGMAEFITKEGKGVLNFTKANTYTVPTNIDAGTLKLSEDGTLGDGTKDVTVKDGATLEIANTKAVSNYINLFGNGYDSVGALYFSESGSTTGEINMQTASIGVAKGKTGTIAGKLYGGGASGRTLTKVGEGTLKLTSDTNTFKILAINDGTVSFAGDSALTGEVGVVPGGSLEFAKSIETNQIIRIKGTGYNDSGALRILADSKITNNLTLDDADATVYVEKDVTGSVTAGLYGKTNKYTLTKTGEGTFRISTTANSIKGVVVKDGVLEVASANALGANNVKMDGGTLKLTMNPGRITFASSTDEWKASGTFEVHAAANEEWNIANTFNDAGVSFVKTGAGTIGISGDRSAWAMKSVEIKEGTLRIYAYDPSQPTPESQARVFPKTSNVQVYEGATVEYTLNPKDYNTMPIYTLQGGELKTSMNDHLTAGEINLYGGTLTGTGDGSANFGNFLFDKNITVYPSEKYGNTSAINAKAVEFSFRGATTKAINVQEGAQLDVNAVIKFYQAGGMAEFITKEGKGVLNFTQANTYAVPTNINAGTLKLSEAGTLGATGQKVTVKSGATLEIANEQALANPLTISGTGSASAGAVNLTADGELSGVVTLGADATINVGKDVWGTLSGSVAASTFTLTKTGEGALTIAENCTVASNLVVSEGVLNLSERFPGNWTSRKTRRSFWMERLATKPSSKARGSYRLKMRPERACKVS